MNGFSFILYLMHVNNLSLPAGDVPLPANVVALPPVPSTADPLSLVPVLVPLSKSRWKKEKALDMQHTSLITAYVQLMHMPL